MNHVTNPTSRATAFQILVQIRLPEAVDTSSILAPRICIQMAKGLIDQSKFLTEMVEVKLSNGPGSETAKCVRKVATTT